MAPGSFAVLYRNNRFETLFRHPKSDQLLILVTDESYVNNVSGTKWENVIVHQSSEGAEHSGEEGREGNPAVSNFDGDMSLRGPIAKTQADIKITWFLLVNNATGPPFKYHLSDLKLDNLDLTTIFNYAEAEVLAGTEIYSLILTIRSDNKPIPEWHRIVRRDDNLGFETLKMELLDLIRESEEKGVKHCKILLEVNPALKERHVD